MFLRKKITQKSKPKKQETQALLRRYQEVQKRLYRNIDALATGFIQD